MVLHGSCHFGKRVNPGDEFVRKSFNVREESPSLFKTSLRYMYKVFVALSLLHIACSQAVMCVFKREIRRAAKMVAILDDVVEDLEQ